MAIGSCWLCATTKRHRRDTARKRDDIPLVSDDIRPILRSPYKHRVRELLHSDNRGSGAYCQAAAKDKKASIVGLLNRFENYELKFDSNGETINLATKTQLSEVRLIVVVKGLRS